VDAGSFEQRIGLDDPGIAPGVYVLEVTTAQASARRKVVIE